MINMGSYRNNRHKQRSFREKKEKQEKKQHDQSILEGIDVSSELLDVDLENESIRDIDAEREQKRKEREERRKNAPILLPKWTPDFINARWEALTPQRQRRVRTGLIVTPIVIVVSLFLINLFIPSEEPESNDEPQQEQLTQEEIRQQRQKEQEKLQQRIGRQQTDLEQERSRQEELETERERLLSEDGETDTEKVINTRRNVNRESFIEDWKTFPEGRVTVPYDDEPLFTSHDKTLLDEQIFIAPTDDAGRTLEIAALITEDTTDEKRKQEYNEKDSNTHYIPLIPAELHEIGNDFRTHIAASEDYLDVLYDEFINEVATLLEDNPNGVYVRYSPRYVGSNLIPHGVLVEAETREGNAKGFIKYIPFNSTNTHPAVSGNEQLEPANQPSETESTNQ